MHESIAFDILATMDSTGHRIREIREALGMSQQAFADALTEHFRANTIEGEPHDRVSRGAVGNWELDKPIGIKNLRAICERWNISFDWLTSGKGLSPELLGGAPAPAKPSQGQFMEAELDRSAPQHNRYEGARPTIEIQGSAMGSIVHDVEGFQIEGSVIDRIPCPPHLAGITGIYGIYVTGDSMVPMHNPSEVRIVHPGRPVNPGDTVIVQTKKWDDDPGQGYIKIFRRKQRDSIILEQLNPKAMLEIPIKYVKSVHHVLTMNEVLGM